MELVKEFHTDSSWILELYIQQVNNSPFFTFLFLIWKENEPAAYVNVQHALCI